MKNKYSYIIGTIFIIVFSFLIINSFIYNEVTVMNTNVSEINDNYNKNISYSNEVNDELDEYENSDIVGSLILANKINVLVQTENNDYYLNHALDGSYDYRGSIFLDYRVDIKSSPKLLIYGHSSNNEDMPFNFLQNYYNNESYYNKHKYIEVIVDDVLKKYEIFSVYVETSDFSYMDTDFYSDDEYFSHIEDLKNKSIYDSDVELSKDDEILILQTCSTHSDYKNFKNKYLLIVSRRI